MRHRKHKRMPGTSAEHRKALLRNQMIALIQHRRIQTTLAKAKIVQPEFDRLIALAREDTPHNRRMALSRLASKEAMRKLFSFAPQQYEGRTGGFTRITRLGPRKGDAAEMALIELV
ncbi:MAG: 50S ribosomal protein L17 [Chloroflexi bacterium AL-W]|nr:50S ribosomal protein L17 [Chloroflexi bacterium AL-N1]NOK66761.1 50S ribosomal protein L17 [Chloroflexi bacterium AL-N10]NOK74947.1 50S ribosomal protein L17 [Chloroflexi bacterium AL-N5]NOK81364.1 50S ribosomal protein L17 [Chloroflexi bacterium AL-W]NOK88833.1 50S ribosomal protein L17 [Chloroflexi bacterium AL-N15]